jgi:LPXTG-motif cell wall-anchored protein
MFPTHPLRRTLAATGAVLVLVLAAFAVAASSAAAASTGSLPLHNDTAETTTDCPTTGYAYWHFVLAPNDGSSAFVTIVLNLDGDLVTFQGDQIVLNHGQLDNVYVGVPAGYTLGSLEAEGSYATFSGGDPSHFNLSHVCTGVVPPTTTTTTEVPPPPPPPTVPETTTTTSGAEVLGTTTINEGAAVEATTEVLPYTGSDDLWLAVTGLSIAGAGFALATVARRRQRV